VDSLSRVMVATSTVVNQIPPCLCTHELMVTSFDSCLSRPECRHFRDCALRNQLPAQSKLFAEKMTAFHSPNNRFSFMGQFHLFAVHSLNERHIAYIHSHNSP
jgi:hypothetical protein